MALRLPKLDKSMPIVEFIKGRFVITAAFQRWWQESVIKSDSTGSGLGDKVNTVVIDSTDPDALSKICLALQNRL